MLFFYNLESHNAGLVDVKKEFESIKIQGQFFA